MTEMTTDGVRGNEQAFGGIAIGETLGDQAGDGELGLGERRPAGVRPSDRDQAPAHSEVPQTTAQPRDVAGGTGRRIAFERLTQGLDRWASGTVIDSRDAEVLERRREGQTARAFPEQLDCVLKVLIAASVSSLDGLGPASRPPAPRGLARWALQLDRLV